jgi:hypothetical protein
MFDPSIVNSAMERLQNCDSTKHLGKPKRILLCDKPLGVGIEFVGDVRNAVAFRGPLASENLAETKRRIEQWLEAESL